MKRREFGQSLAIAGGLLVAPAIVRAQGQNGVALVIGNSKYKWEASLPNVRRDAPDIAKAFQALGLRTELVVDAGKDAMFAAVEKFKAAARGADLAAFYFAGHGVSWDKDTYLVPEDADLGNPGAAQTLLPVTAIGAAVKEARHRLLIFDNCRNNPADGWRQRAAMATARVYAAEQTGSILREANTLVIYSTASGRVALDGPAGENSPFAAALLRQLDEPSVDLRALPERLRRDLLIATQCRQLVWDQNTYSQAFLVRGLNNRPPARPVAAPVHDASRIVELKNTYAFAREKGLSVPPGLIAYRTSGGSPHARMIGAFKYDFLQALGDNGGRSLEPNIAAVLSITDNDTAEVVVASRFWGGPAWGISGNGAYWRFTSAKIAGDRLNWPGQSGSGLWELKWRNANSGSVSYRENFITPDQGFTRLDG
jgi:Caspase domain